METMAGIAPTGETRDVTSHSRNNTQVDSNVNSRACRGLTGRPFALTSDNDWRSGCPPTIPDSPNDPVPRPAIGIDPMRIVGFTETSLLDWHGRISAVLWIGGCDFACPFCHNYRIADDDPELALVPLEEIALTLRRKRDWYDGVVLTGGEPLMHPEVFELCRRLKDIGQQVKVDTNGSFPYALKALLELELVDAVAMDVKAPLDSRYARAAGRPVDIAPLRRTIRLLLESGVEHEFRCTLVPGLMNPEDIAAVGEAIKGAQAVALQAYLPKLARVKGFGGERAYTRSEVEAMAEVLKSCVREVRIRGSFS
jgi:pyruvate formate lyase activating enzyme